MDKFDKFIQEIIDKADILTIIGSFSTFKKIADNTYVGKCPFSSHDERHFFINTKEKTWKCYVHREGGNIIDFIMLKESLKFHDAIARLAGQLGLEIPDFLAPLWAHEAEEQKRHAECPKNVPSTQTLFGVSPSGGIIFDDPMEMRRAPL